MRDGSRRHGCAAAAAATTAGICAWGMLFVSMRCQASALHPEVGRWASALLTLAPPFLFQVGAGRRSHVGDPSCNVGPSLCSFYEVLATGNPCQHTPAVTLPDECQQAASVAAGVASPARHPHSINRQTLLNARYALQKCCEVILRARRPNLH